MTAWVRRAFVAPRSSERYGLVALYLATVAVYSDMYITQPLLPLLGAEFHIAPATAGLTVSVMVLAIGLGSTVYGPLSDSFGRKPVMVWSCLLLAIPTLLCAVAPSFALLLLFRGWQGLLIPGLTAVAVAYIGDQADGGDIGAAVGGYIGATVTGGLLSRVLSGLITEYVHWRATFVVFAALTCASGLLMARVLPHAEGPERVRWADAYRDMVQHLGNRRLMGGFVIGAALFFGHSGVFTYLSYYLSAAPFNLSTGLVSSVYGVFVMGAITAPLAGRISTRIGRRTTMTAGLLTASLGMLGTLVPLLPLIVLSLLVFMIGMFITQSTAPAYINATAASAKGGASALYLTFYYVGGALGSLLPGYAWQTWGWPGVITACLGASVVAVLASWQLCEATAPKR